jgi:hypothetical protein
VQHVKAKGGSKTAAPMWPPGDHHSGGCAIRRRRVPAVPSAQAVRPSRDLSKDPAAHAAVTANFELVLHGTRRLAFPFGHLIGRVLAGTSVRADLIVLGPEGSRSCPTVTRISTRCSGTWKPRITRPSTVTAPHHVHFDKGEKLHNVWTATREQPLDRGRSLRLVFFAGGTGRAGSRCTSCHSIGWYRGDIAIGPLWPVLVGRALGP